MKILFKIFFVSLFFIPSFAFAAVAFDKSGSINGASPQIYQYLNFNLMVEYKISKTIR